MITINNSESAKEHLLGKKYQKTAFLGLLILLCAGATWDSHFLSGLETSDLAEVDRSVMFVVVGLTVGVVRERSLRAEKGLNESERRYRLLAENVKDAIWVLDLNMRPTYMSPSITRLLGYSVEEAMAKRMEEVFTPASFEAAMKALAEELAIEEMEVKDIDRSRTMEFELIRKDGSIVPIEIKYSFLRDPDGRPVEILAIARDITERKQAEEALHKSEKLFQSLVDNILDAVLIIDWKGKILLANKAAAELGGFKSEKEVLGLNALDFIHPSYKASVIKDLALVKLDKGEFFKTYKMVTKNGEERWIESIGTKIKFRDNTADLVSLRDVTERKQAENELRKHRDHLEELVEERTSELVTANEQLKREIAKRTRAEEQIGASLREKEVLLKEIHHRIKNNLQIISSLLYLQSQYISDERVLALVKESRSRVESMALIHDRLYRSENLARIDFADYTQKLTTDLINSYGIDPAAITLKTDVDALLGIDIAIPCGLIINEFVSNSLKYAFPEGGRGEINVELHSDTEGTFTLIVRDNGIGIPKDLDFRKSESLGLQLVCTLVDQLEGTIELDRSGGTAFTITFAELKHKKRG